MLSPITPAPITTVFGRDDGTMIDGVMADALRRARPARFSGFYLSRSRHAASAAGLSGTPASCQFRTETLPMQGFSSPSRAAPAPSTELPVAQERCPSIASLGLARRISAAAKQWTVVRLRVGKA